MVLCVHVAQVRRVLADADEDDEENVLAGPRMRSASSKLPLGAALAVDLPAPLQSACWVRDPSKGSDHSLGQAFSVAGTTLV